MLCILLAQCAYPDMCLFAARGLNMGADIVSAF